jgi:IclR family transcriptional regulator, pca regulon regulatory protein
MAGRPHKSAKQQPRSRYFIEAIGRGLDVLSLFDVEHPSLSLTEIAKRSKCVPSTALRFIQTLVDLDYLEELTESGRYRPSLAALKLGHTALSTSLLRSVARPILERVQKETAESVNLVALAGSNVILVDTLAEPDVLSLRFKPGSRFPAASTAAGKAMLSQQQPAELELRFSRYAFPKLGPNTITSFKELEAALRVARRDGFAIDDEELAAGLRAISAPVIGVSAPAQAAIGVVVGSARMSVERLRRDFAPIAVKAAGELSDLLRASQ